RRAAARPLNSRRRSQAWSHHPADLSPWLSGLCERDQTMLALRQAGHTLTEIGLHLAASTTAVCARLRELGAQVLLLIGGAS
ncbi:MAG TPA: hypothetical protein VF316_06260, partial [Polyangiaceae bacterium]